MDNAPAEAEHNQPGQAPEDANGFTINFDAITNDEFQQLDTVVQAVLAGQATREID
jgi:hypothetical protein